MSSLGDRIKSYERAHDHRLQPNSAVIIRVDGRAFHTYTRQECFRDGAPFSDYLMMAMLNAGIRTAREMAGFKLGYTQSDECTFLLTDLDSHDTEGWFGYRVAKLVSVTASLFTAHFAALTPESRSVGAFDARVFTVPLDDAPNVFLWRQRDWERNSLSMLARHHYGQGALQGVRRAELHDLLHAKGVNWADLSPIEKNGAFFQPDGGGICAKLDYDGIQTLIEGGMPT